MATKFTVHLDGSGSWGHAYFSVTRNGVTNFYGLWPRDATNPSAIVPGEGMIRGNEPVKNPYYDPTLPADHPNSWETYPGDKQRYDKTHAPDSTTPVYDQDYPMTDKQYKQFEKWVDKVQNDPDYAALNGNCAGFVQDAWGAAGFDGSFADKIPIPVLYEMGRAGLWTMFDFKGLTDFMADGFKWAFSEAAWWAFKNFDVATPIVLDLNGDGIKYVSLQNSRARFDIDNDGFAEHVEWISKKDGFLVRDLNKNGKIDNQSELFSDNGGTRAYDKLAALDSNGDKKIDAKDSVFSSLKIWRDLDGDGVTDKGELMSLKKAGIKSLSLQKSQTTELNGHAVDGTSIFTWQNGKKGVAADVLLDTDQMDTWYNRGDISVDSEALYLPLSRGYGQLKALHYAVSEDSELKRLVKELASLNVKSEFHLVYDKAQALLLQWAKALSVAPGEYGDGAKLAFLQKLTQIAGTNNVDEPFGIFTGVMLERLLAQGPLSHVFTEAYYDFTRDAMVLRQPFADILSKAKAGEPTEPKGHDIYWNEIARIVLAHPEEFSLNAAQLKAQIDAKAGFKTVVIDLQGTSGADHLIANFQAHTFAGGAGNDHLEALRSGEDTFFVSKGDGHDTIIGANGDDTLVFGSGISWASVTLEQTNGYLVINLPGGGSVTMPHLDVDAFVFADGTVKTLQQVLQTTIDRAATAGNDTIIGYGTDDTIMGGRGNDYMDGYAGEDVFVVNQGDGHDTIFGGSAGDTLRFGSGITWSSLAAKHIGGVGLVISLPGGGTVTMPWVDVDSFVFSDGTVKSVTDVIKLAMAQTPTSGDDALYGLWTDDVINGGAGHDWIGGYGGNDLLLGGSGNDQLHGDWEDDTLNGGAGADTLIGGSGADVFVYKAVNESTGTMVDFIEDFIKAEDVIDLRGLGFSSVKAGAASGAKLGYSYDGGSNVTTLVSANGLKIQLAGQVDLGASDFLF